MYKISNQDIITNHRLIEEVLTKGKVDALMEDVFIRKAYPILEKEAHRQYPYKVYLPKSINEMLEGDFSPARVIDVNGPIQGPWSNMWFGDSSTGINLHGGGYINGDSRYVCMNSLGDADVHMILAGATGQGKSVALNSFIMGICMEYAPWEVKLTMCDAKIVEFKTYATKLPMPHIRSIAATGDADYLISVLDDLSKEMIKMNSVFTVAQVKNIKDFRKKTGLALPQNLIVIDEFQTMFKYAKKRAKDILDILDNFARLGRNTGYHLLLASQEIGTDIPANMLGNIKLRGALGCFAKVSNQILGNDAAADNYGKKGRLIINNNPSSGSKADNINLRVPFMPDNQLIEVGQYIIKKGNEFKLDNILSFYDEQKLIYERNYKDYLSQFNLSKNRIYLGEPSYVMDGEEKCVRLNFTGTDIENILVLAGTADSLRRYFKMLKYNVELVKHQGITNILINADSIFDECHPETLPDQKVFYFEDKSYDSKFFKITTDLVNKRKLCIAVDKRVFDNLQYDDFSDNLFYQLYPKGSPYDTELYRSRFYYMYDMLTVDETTKKTFGLDNAVKINQEAVMSLISNFMYTYSDYGCNSSKLERNDMPMIHCWVLGMSKIIGIGRDSKSANLTKFKKVLQDGSDVNVRFFMFTNTLEDMTDLRSGVRYFIMDDVSTREVTKTGLSDDYPDQKSSGLGVIADTSLSVGKCKKFKKMFFDGELPPSD